MCEAIILENRKRVSTVNRSVTIAVNMLEVGTACKRKEPIRTELTFPICSGIWSREPTDSTANADGEYILVVGDSIAIGIPGPYTVFIHFHQNIKCSRASAIANAYPIIFCFFR